MFCMKPLETTQHYLLTHHVQAPPPPATAPAGWVPMVDGIALVLALTFAVVVTWRTLP